MLTKFCYLQVIINLFKLTKPPIGHEEKKKDTENFSEIIEQKDLLHLKILF